jgi:hypothetical protein
MKLLPKEQYRIEISIDSTHIMASIYEHPEGFRYWLKYDLCDLPNDFISLDDLKRLGINTVNK